LTYNTVFENKPEMQVFVNASLNEENYE